MDSLDVFRGIGVNPTLQEIEQIIVINNRDYPYSLNYAIKHLEINNYIQITLDENGQEIYLLGANIFPQLYNYEQYGNEIPK